MDILICFAIGMMALIAAAQLSYWATHGREILAPQLRSATMLLMCLTMLVFLLFGTRLFLRPDVAITYTDRTFDLYSNQTINASSQVIIESKHLIGCEVNLVKSYPLMFVLGRETKTLKFKLPCDTLSPEMKTDIANTTSYLREDKS
jgi:hypothetical protein